MPVPRSVVEEDYTPVPGQPPRVSLTVEQRDGAAAGIATSRGGEGGVDGVVQLALTEAPRRTQGQRPSRMECTRTLSSWIYLGRGMTDYRWRRRPS
jgi:hypothetical protein